MKILITGGCGFVGSNLAVHLKDKYPQYRIVAFDNLKRRGSELNISRFKDREILFVHGDIRSYEDFLSLEEGFDCIIDAAAEPSVLSGLEGDISYLIDSNLNGTVNTLKFAEKQNASFIFLSTSRVYPIDKMEAIRYEETESRFEILNDQPFPGVGPEGISELFPIEGYRSFYGATKLSSEFLISEFNQFRGLKTVINRCGVITGPWQMGKIDQGVAALWVAKHIWRGDLSYIGYNGTGKQVRDMLNVVDLVDLVDLQIHNIEKFNGATHNVGGGRSSSVSLKELTHLCEKITGNKINIGRITENRPADLPIYVTDTSKIYKEADWAPKIPIEDTIASIYHWMIENEKMVTAIFN